MDNLENEKLPCIETATAAAVAVHDDDAVIVKPKYSWLKDKPDNEEKKEDKKKAAVSEAIKKIHSNWSYGSYRGNDGYLQPDHQTREERFPKIFDSVKILKPKAKRVLSFGCSTGEECQALATRFPNAEIVGVDIDHYTIQSARRRNKNSRIVFHDQLGATGKYDLITCLQVLFCMQSKIPKDRWTSTLVDIDKHLNPGGLLAIYTSEYNPLEVLGNKYFVKKEWTRIHNKNQKEYFCGYYQKKTTWRYTLVNDFILPSILKDIHG